ncbi:MAG: hypothetical protein V7754_23415, partial [Halioglobus sp.]
MNKTLFIPVVFVGLLNACSEHDVTIDTTPVIALAVGGTVSLLQQAGTDFDKPDSETWQAAQEYSVNLNL